MSTQPTPVQQLVRTSTSGPVATIRLDSPKNRNALSRQLRRELGDHLDRAITDPAVRVLVLTHDGPAFCSGADLAEIRTRTDTDHGEVPVGDLIATLWNSPKPVIAVLRGPARAGGTGLMAACDLVIADESVSFAFSEVRIGVIPAVISAPLAARVQPAKLHHYFLTGESIDAREALAIGLVNAAAESSEIDATLSRYTELLLRGAPQALAGAKTLVRPKAALSSAKLAGLNELSVTYFDGEEAAEGMTAFLEKRDPSWVNPQ